MMTKDVPLGFRLPSRTKVMTREQIAVYVDKLFSVVAGKPVSSGKNIHTDDEFARAQGLPAAVADGMISTAMISSLMVDAFGDGYLRGGKLSTRYVKPVYAGDVLTVRATIRDKKVEGKSTRFELDVSCENQKGDVVTAGTASGVVH